MNEVPPYGRADERAPIGLVQRFRGGLVFEAQRLFVPLKSRRASNIQVKKSRKEGGSGRRL